jgi:predicted nuclease of predicted toxin-antitoxin system
VKGLILDQGIPRSAASLLRAGGIEAVHVGELGMATSSDESILEYAHRNELAVVTLDADFHAQLSLSGASAPSVIRLRAIQEEGERGISQKLP